MRKVKVYMQEQLAGTLFEIENGRKYRFAYNDDYNGSPISLTMPTNEREYEFDFFPPFFEGLLPEGFLLESLLRIRKIDRNDFFSQLAIVGRELVGAVTVEEA